MGIRDIDDSQLQRIGYQALNIGANATYEAIQRELMRRVMERAEVIAKPIPPARFHLIPASPSPAFSK